MSGRIRVVRLGVLALLAFCAHTLADVNLEWRPDVGAAFVGEEVRLGLYAVSDSGTDQSLSSVRVVFSWDNVRLAFLGLDNTGGAPFIFSELPVGGGACGLNETIPPEDGEGVYEAGTLGEPVAATSGGTLLTTFRFQVVNGDGGTATVATQAQSASAGCETTVIDGNNPGLNIVGSMDAMEFTAFPEGIPAASEWALAVLTFAIATGGTLILRSRRRSP